MSDPVSDDKIGKELSAQRFQMLEDIAKELAGDVLFPTCFTTAERIRKPVSYTHLDVYKRQDLCHRAVQSGTHGH